MSEYLQRNLQGYSEKDGYCSGKYVGSVTNLVESFMAVSNSAFRRASAHRRGTSKRLKGSSPNTKNLWFSHLNSLVPIPYSGHLFEIIGSEIWNCCVTEDGKPNVQEHNCRKRSKTAKKCCPASIHVRTVKVYTDHVNNDDNLLHNDKKKQEKLKQNLLKKIKAGEKVEYKVVCYCRFPLHAAHCYHTPSIADITSNRMDRRVAKKIKDLVRSGIHDVSEVESMLVDHVKTSLFGHLDNDEMPNLANTRYFPTKRVIYKHIASQLGSMKKLGEIESCEQIAPTVMEISQFEKSEKETRAGSCGIGMIAVHAGAGFHSVERWPGYRKLCDEACWFAWMCLREGGSAGEAVAIATKVLEDSELTNAGFGSNLTEIGTIECDASVMDGSVSEDGVASYGAVTGISSIKNPVHAAYHVARQQIIEPRLSLGRIPPCTLCGTGAEKWARAHGVEVCGKDRLISEGAHKTWQKYQKRLLESLRQNKKSTDTTSSPERFDTVGAVAIDVHGRVASAASSGGLLMKLPGRVGQAAMYGCGCWAENGDDSKPAIAIATTGCGEQLMYTMAAKKCSENLKSQTQPYVAVQETLLHDILNSPYLDKDTGKQVGLLALHHTKDESNNTIEVLWGHTTKSMLVAHMSTKDTKPEVILSRLPENATAGKSVSVSGTWIKIAGDDATLFTVETDAEDSDDNTGVVTHPIKTNTDQPQTPQVDGSWDKIVLDDELSLMHVSSNVEGISMESCLVEMSENYNRKIDNDFEKKIEIRWQKRQKKNPRLFNAYKFRIHSVETQGDKLKFCLGLTCYRDYMETNWSEDVDWLREKGKKEFGNTQAYLSEPLGVAGVIITSDDHVIFQRRNHWVAEGAGKLDVPGGHPEPAEAADVGKNAKIDTSQLQAGDVIKEIFTSQLKEVRDEVNIPLECLSEPRLLGLVRNKLSAGRPVCYFVIRCTLSCKEVEDLYKKGGAETDESTQLVFLHEKQLTYLQRDSPKFWSDLCPNGKAAVSLYSILKQAQHGEIPFQTR